MLRSPEVPLGALVAPFQVAPGAFCQYSNEAETSEERSSDEHYDGPGQSMRRVNSGSRSWGVTSSACRGVSRNSAVACASWVPSFLAATYFQPCERHRHHKKNECTFFCITCGSKPHSVCQHCMGAHAGHQVIQVRRYVYCDVVRACDISPFVDATGVQNYIINSAKVMFLNHRPHSKIGRANGVDICRTCHRHLREGYSYCSLACKVEALTRGETTPSGGVDAVSRASPEHPVSGGSAATAAAAAAASALLPTSAGSPRQRSAIFGGAARSTGGAASLNARTQPVFALAARSAFAAAAMPYAVPPGSPDLANAADASCAGLSSDLESSEPGEDVFAFGGGGGGGAAGSGRSSGGGLLTNRSYAAARRRAAAALTVDRESSQPGYSTTSKDTENYCHELNFENPPKRRRSCHITRRPSTSNGYDTAAATCSPPVAAAAAAAPAVAVTRRASVNSDVADVEAAVAAAATLLMPFRTASSGLLPAAPAPPPPPASASAATAFGVPSLYGDLEASATAGASACATVEMTRAASASAAMCSRRKQQAPQRAPSC